jgi:hypothetical protein
LGDRVVPQGKMNSAKCKVKMAEDSADFFILHFAMIILHFRPLLRLSRRPQLGPDGP